MPNDHKLMREGDRVSVLAYMFDSVTSGRKSDVQLRWSYQHFGAKHWKTARCFGTVVGFQEKNNVEVVWTDELWQGTSDLIRRDWLRLETHA